MRKELKFPMAKCELQRPARRAWRVGQAHSLLPGHRARYPRLSGLVALTARFFILPPSAVTRGIANLPFLEAVTPGDA